MKNILYLFPILFLFCASLSAQDNAWGSFTESHDVEFSNDTLLDMDYPLGTTDITETILLYDAATGKPTGEMVYKNGNYYMENHGMLTKLTRSELIRMFSPGDFKDYRKAKKQWNASIPLFAIGSCAGAVAVAGAGLWLYNWVRVTKGIYSGDNEAFRLSPAVTGFTCIVAGLVVSAATLIPAFNLYNKGNSMMSSLAYDYNYSHNSEINGMPNSGKRPASNTSMRITIGGTSQGVGVAFHF